MNLPCPAMLLVMVSLLGDDDFRTREMASKCLDMAGPHAVPYLWRGASSSDLEIRHRCKKLLRKYRPLPLSSPRDGWYVYFDSDVTPIRMWFNDNRFNDSGVGIIYDARFEWRWERNTLKIVWPYGDRTDHKPFSESYTDWRQLSKGCYQCRFQKQGRSTVHVCKFVAKD